MAGVRGVLVIALAVLVAAGCGTAKAPKTGSDKSKITASVTALNDLKNQMDAIDRDVQASGRNKPTSRAEVRTIVAVWRPTPERYDELFRQAKPLARKAQTFDDHGLGVHQMWSVFVEMLHQRRDGMRASVTLFDRYLATGSFPPKLAARLQALKRESDVLNARFERLALAYNKKANG